MFIKSSTKVLILKNQKKFRVSDKNSLKTVRKYRELAEIFCAYIESCSYKKEFLNGYSKGVAIHSNILHRFFGTGKSSAHIIKTLIQIGAINFKEAIWCDKYSVCRTFLPRETTRYTFVPVSNPAYVDSLYKHISEYFIEHQSVYDSDYEELSDSYNKLSVDISEANDIMKDKFGISYYEMKELLKGEKIEFDNSKMRAYCAYCAINDLNDKHYRMVSKYGRVYTPFHNLPKVLRVAVMVEGKPLREILDAHAAFIRFSSATAIRFFEECRDAEGMKEMKVLMKALDDFCFYEEMTDSTLDRKTVKKTVLSICFSASHQKKWKLMMFRSLFDKLGDPSVKVFVNIYKDFAMDKDTDLSKEEMAVLKKFFKEVVGERVKLNNIKSTLDINKLDKKHVKSFINYAESVTFSLVFNKLQAKYPKFVEFLYDFDEICRDVMSDYNKTVSHAVGIANSTDGSVKWDKKHLPNVMTLNLSTECQRIESKCLINKVLPFLKDQYAGSTFVTLHDAVFSDDTSIGADEVRNVFYDGLDNLAKNIDFSNMKKRRSCIA